MSKNAFSAQKSLIFAKNKMIFSGGLNKIPSHQLHEKFSDLKMVWRDLPIQTPNQSSLKDDRFRKEDRLRDEIGLWEGVRLWEGVKLWDWFNSWRRSDFQHSKWGSASR